MGNRRYYSLSIGHWALAIPITQDLRKLADRKPKCRGDSRIAPTRYGSNA